MGFLNWVYTLTITQQSFLSLAIGAALVSLITVALLLRWSDWRKDIIVERADKLRALLKSEKQIHAIMCEIYTDARGRPVSRILYLVSFNHRKEEHLVRLSQGSNGFSNLPDNVREILDEDFVLEIFDSLYKQLLDKPDSLISCYVTKNQSYDYEGCEIKREYIARKIDILV